MKSTLKLANKLYKEKYSKIGVFISKNRAQAFFDEVLGLVFPEIGQHIYKNEDELYFDLAKTQQELNFILRSINPDKPPEVLTKVTEDFFGELGSITDILLKDAEFFAKQDPAASLLEEIIICYPGFYAISAYRIAHFFHKRKLAIFPRLITELARQKTGIDIHPGAEIGNPFFVDHGTGVVIGETAVIGNNVKIYQGVTLGALLGSKEEGQTKKRHPTIEDDVCIYANASIFGGETVVGKGSIIGGNVVLTSSVPPKSQIYFSQDKIIKSIVNS